MIGNKFKILHLSETSEPGGAETVLPYIASNLDPQKYDSLVCLLEDGWLTDHLKTLGTNFRIIENRWPYDPIFIAKLIKLIIREKIDLIHAHEFMMNVYGSLAARLTGIPMIGTVHGKLYFTDANRRIYFYKMAVSLCSRMVLVSKDLESFFIENLRLKNTKKLKTLYNGIDLSKYNSGHSDINIRKELAISPGTPLIGTVGSLFKVKGIPTLIEAVEIMKKCHPDLVLLVVGSGNQEEELKKMVHDLGYNDTIRFLGFRNDIPDILKALDVYICSSISEGLSLSIIEAMATGIPIVATDVGGNPELVKQGQNGFLVPSANPEAIADKALLLLNDPSLRKTMGEAGRRVAEEKFSLEKMIENYQYLYAELLN